MIDTCFFIYPEVKLVYTNIVFNNFSPLSIDFVNVVALVLVSYVQANPNSTSCDLLLHRYLDHAYINASARYELKFESLKLGVASPKSVFSMAVLAAAVMLSHAIKGCSPP
jgi:hypothetical protein